MKKNELEIIKEGKTGYGILIENDGYVQLDKSKLIKEGMGDGEWYVPNPFIVSAVFQKFGIKNANGRIYPESVLKKQVELYQQKIDEKRALAELNHPSDSTIDLGRISHNIIELHWVGQTLVGQMQLNVTEGFRKYGIISSRGDDAAQLLLQGWKIGVSSRGVGSVEQRLGQQIVGEDFELIGFDIVSDPSTPNAYISLDGEEGLRTYIESKEIKNFSPLNEKINRIKNILNS
jgi:hypothetical protein